MSDPDRKSGDICPECGAAVAGGRAGCRALFEEVLTREYSDYRYSRLHRLTVDTYAMQHPDEGMRSARSYAAHLTGMYAALQGDPTAVNRLVQLWLSGPKELDRPDQPPPLQRGILSVTHVHQAKDPEEHLELVRQWAEATWDAWEDYHDLAREWIMAAQQSAAVFDSPSPL